MISVSRFVVGVCFLGFGWKLLMILFTSRFLLLERNQRDESADVVDIAMACLMKHDP